MTDQKEKIKVCVIGAGAAGLCAVKHLAANTIFEITAYEQTNDIGGTWVYKEQVGLDENGLPIHSSMYQNLRFDVVCFYYNVSLNISLLYKQENNYFVHYTKRLFEIM